MRNRVGSIGAMTLALIVGSAASLPACAQSSSPPSNEDSIKVVDVAVVYGLPLVMMDLTMQNMTHTAAPRGAPTNQFLNVRAFPPATFKQIVRANVDTLYSSAFLDLSKEPLVLSAPDTHGRYYLLPIFDAWTDVFASPGARTTGTQQRNFLIVGPDWHGAPPAEMQVLRSPTNMAWILGRTQTNGPDDYAAVHAIQDGYRLVPLSRYGAPESAPPLIVNSSPEYEVPPIERLRSMSYRQFLESLAHLLKSNPPSSADATIVAKLATIGVVPGEEFDPSRLAPTELSELDKPIAPTLGKLEASVASQRGDLKNGWYVPTLSVGQFGTNYRLRAVITLIAFGANLPQDAIYPTTYLDDHGQPLNGSNAYTLHFDKGHLPPVRAFWSVTLYGPDSFFVPNSINRAAISSWMPLKYAPDGSLDIYIQPHSPGPDKESNWLPSRNAENFNLTLRMYWPSEQPPSIIDGSWVPPGVMPAP